jgi:putative lipoprotein
MRKTICSLVSVTALALAGCNGSSSPQPAAGQGNAAAPAAPQATKVTGTVTLREPAQLSPASKLVVNLVDVSAAPDASAPPLATKTITPAAQFPLDFELPFTPADVNPNDLYVIKAELTDGDRRYAMLLQAPVLTKGASAQVTIQLVAKQTPAEKELADFESVKKQIGGMKIKSDTKLEKDASRGWQIFRADGQVKFIREQVDYGAKGFTDTDYAYKDGKPWVAVQQKKASQGAAPNTTERAGWAPDGSVTLKQSIAGGKTTDLGDDEAGSLKQQAEDILKLATGGKGK